METLGMIFSDTLRGYYRYHHMIFSSFGLYRGQQWLFFTLKKEGFLTQNELAKRMNIAAPTLTRMIHNLEKKGFIAREKDKADRRKTIVRLTEEGNEVHGIISEKLKAADDKIFHSFNKEEKEIFRKFLLRIQDQLHENMDAYRKGEPTR